MKRGKACDARKRGEKDESTYHDAETSTSCLMCGRVAATWTGAGRKIYIFLFREQHACAQGQHKKRTTSAGKFAEHGANRDGSISRKTYISTTNEIKAGRQHR